MNANLQTAEHASHHQLLECERKIEDALDTGYHALRQIHDDKLYKADGYSSFKEYAEQRWGWSKTHAYRLIDYSKVVDRLKADGVDHIPSEGQLRPLTKLKRSSKNEDDFLNRASAAAKIAIDTAPHKDSTPRVTAEHTESVMSQFGYHGRKGKPKDDAAAVQLRGILTKLAHSDALQKYTDGYDFVKKHGDSAFPDGYLDVIDWLREAADAISAE